MRTSALQIDAYQFETLELEGNVVRAVRGRPRSLNADRRAVTQRYSVRATESDCRPAGVLGAREDLALFSGVWP
jgi:hypothetical protein